MVGRVSDLVLSLFPGIGMLDMAFEEEGFCVVRGPDLLWGGDVRRFHPPAGKFDGVIGGPPCQAFSRLKHLNPRAGAKHGNLIPEFERCVAEARPAWFLMENVTEAPSPTVEGYYMKRRLVRDVWVGGETNRLRAFTFGTSLEMRASAFDLDWLALHTPTPKPPVLASDGGRHVPVKIGGNGKPKRSGAALLADRSSRSLPEACRLQDLPADFLADSPFTYRGKRLMVGNGVPLPMGRAIAHAVKKAITQPNGGT